MQAPYPWRQVTQLEYPHHLLEDIVYLTGPRQTDLVLELAIDAHKSYPNHFALSSYFSTTLHIFKHWQSDPLSVKKELQPIRTLLVTSLLHQSTTRHDEDTLRQLFILTLSLLISADSTNTTHKTRLTHRSLVSYLTVKHPPGENNDTAVSTDRAYTIYHYLKGPIPPNLSSEWANSTTAALDREVRRTRDHSILPILADALEEAGCTHEETLTLLRTTPEGLTPSSWIIKYLAGGT